jgi:hypothetical protein
MDPSKRRRNHSDPTRTKDVSDGRGEPTVNALDIQVRAELRECRSSCSQLEP